MKRYIIVSLVGLFFYVFMLGITWFSMPNKLKYEDIDGRKLDTDFPSVRSTLLTLFWPIYLSFLLGCVLPWKTSKKIVNWFKLKIQLHNLKKDSNNIYR